MTRSGSAREGVDRPAAEALFKEAVALVAEGDLERACPKFAAALDLYPSAATAVNVALCEEREGRLASAWSAFHRALTLAKETDGLERREALEARAREGIEDLEPRLPRLVVRTGEGRPPDGLLVERDGVALPAASFGTPIPVDPGPTTIVATAPGMRSFEATVTAEEGRELTVVVALEPEVVLTEPTTPPPLVVAPPPPSLPPAAGASDGIPTWAWISGGLGVAFGGVAIAFLIDDLAAIDNLKTRCDLDVEPVACDPGYDVEADNARKNRSGALAVGFGAASVIALGAGVVGIVMGLGGDEPRMTGWSLEPWAVPTAGGMSLGGRF